MDDEQRETHLATLARELIGAKGMADLVQGLLASMTPERKAELAEEIFMRGNYSFEQELRRQLMDTITEGLLQRLQARVVARFEAELPKIEEDLMKELGPLLRRSLQDKFRRAISVGGAY